MSETKNDALAKASATATMPSGTPSPTDLRERAPQRKPSHQTLTPSPRPHGMDRRRSSLLSFSSLDDMTQLLTEDIINPSMRRNTTAREVDEVTHWHSTPLAFAMLPALGGLLFTNGSVFMTDALLLGLAAVFLNWSIRLPWDWYYSAQEQLRDVVPDYLSRGQPLDIPETAVESVSSVDGSPKLSPLDNMPRSSSSPTRDDECEMALSELKRQEIMALLATFVFPVLTAYLLHVIRGQLSNSSTTSLVSDYNLSIFLLAAEIRPCRQLMRLISKRTLHLQRTVTGLDDPLGSAVNEKNIIGNLTTRISELESKLAGNTIVPHNVAIAQKADVNELSAEMKKRYEPRLEGLERAVRRYEKRSTTLAMLIEQRLAQLETRLQDALSLAAVAAQHSNRSTMGRLADNIAMVIAWPAQIGWRLFVSPLHVVEDIYARVRTLLFGPSRARSSKRSGSRQNGLAAKGRDSISRKSVR